jgi:hypothetical protein
MAKTLKQVLRIATLMIGMTATSVALAVATVDVTVTGGDTVMQTPGGTFLTKTEATTINLSDSTTGKQYKAVIDDKKTWRFSVPPGKYDVEVFFLDKKVGSGGTVTFKDGPNNLRVNPDTGGVMLELPPQEGGPINFPGFQLGYFGASAGPNRVTDKPPTIGVIETTPTQTSSMLTGPSRVTTIGEHLFVNFLSGAALGVGYQQGDRSTSAGVSPGTESGWSFWMPVNEITGVSSALGANANFKTKYSAFNLDVGLPSWPKKDPSLSYWGVPKLGYQYSEIKYDGTISNATVPGVSSTTNQKVKENDLSAGYGVRGMYTASNQVWVSGGVGLDAIYYWGRYNGTQDNECAPCAPPIQSYNVSNSDSKNGLTFGAWADAAVGVSVSKDVDLFVQGTYRYDHAVATLVNNVTPTDQAPHLITRDRNWAGIEFGVRVKFNAP